MLIIRKSKLYYTASGIITICRWPSGAWDGHLQSGQDSLSAYCNSEAVLNFAVSKKSLYLCIIYQVDLCVWQHWLSVTRACRTDWKKVKCFNSKPNMNRPDALRARPNTFPNTSCRLKVLFTDEGAVYKSVHYRNAEFWSKKNPHFTVSFEHITYHKLYGPVWQLFSWAPVISIDLLT